VQRKVKRKILGNEWELSMNYDENYHLVYNITWLSHGKVEIYRDTGVSKNRSDSDLVWRIQYESKVYIIYIVPLSGYAST
jgi:hypothetical protein